MHSWASESQRLPKAGRRQSGQDQGLPCPGRVLDSRPFLQESLQGPVPCLRKRRKDCAPDSRTLALCLSGFQNPEENIWVRALRWFQGILQSLQQRCWDVLTWLQEKAVAFLEAVCSAVSTVHRVLSDFCSSVGQLFSEASSRSRNPCCGFSQVYCCLFDICFLLETFFPGVLQESYT